MISLQHLIFKLSSKREMYILINKMKYNNNNNNNNEEEKEINNLPRHTPNSHNLIFTHCIGNIPL